MDIRSCYYCDWPRLSNADEAPFIFRNPGFLEHLSVPRHVLTGPMPIRKGFRSPPINPAKRIKSPKPKKRK